MSKYSTVTIKKRLSELRREYNYTVADIAHKLSELHSTSNTDKYDSIRTMYYKWESETNSSIPSNDYLFDLCDIYDCEIEYFFNENAEYKNRNKLRTDIKEATGLNTPSIDFLLRQPQLQRVYKTKMRLLPPYVLPVASTINLLLGTPEGQKLLDCIFRYIYGSNPIIEVDNKAVYEILYKTDYFNLPITAVELDKIILLEIENVLNTIKNGQK